MRSILRAETLTGNTKHSAAIFVTTRTKSLQYKQEFMFMLYYNQSIILFQIGGNDMNRIISLAAYVGLSELPAYFQEQIRQAFKYVKDAAPNDDNTECYLRKEQDRWYTVTVNFIYLEDEVPEIEEIDLQPTDEEQAILDELIIKGVQYSLEHIEEI